MKKITLSKGLDLLLAGAPEQKIDPVIKQVKHVAVTGPDYVGMKPSILVEVGDQVLAGQALFEDKKNPGVVFTAPGAGTVKEIHRGDKRSFRSIRLELNDGVDAFKSIAFDACDPSELENLCPNMVREQLIRSGLWTTLRTRPFSRIPKVDSVPSSLFVNAMDTNPHAPNPEIVISEREDDFVNGLKVLSRICGKKIWLCKSSKSKIPGADAAKTEVAVFDGPHPAGLAGTHIHYLDPVGSGKTVWTIGYQDVIAIGELFVRGSYPVERIIALSGPMVERPRLIRTHVGACLFELTKNELKSGNCRIISGSVLCGRKVEENGLCCLGPYVNQVSVIGDGDPRELFGWALPAFRKFSIARTVASWYLPKWPFKMNTAVHGGKRAIFPNTMLEDVMPIDILPVQLFRAIENGDIDNSEKLGILELDEEDVALCTLIDLGKNDYTESLRTMLNTIMKEEE
ncbi:MAG: Na(+)-translocating NADH-quinone reductase subunit A [Planctomycetia bacterium]|nr:Na(+)-translocating NADH-quinone reductase subunit A [Planctomycetia bacterium]